MVFGPVRRFVAKACGWLLRQIGLLFDSRLSPSLELGRLTIQNSGGKIAAARILIPALPASIEIYRGPIQPGVSAYPLPSTLTQGEIRSVTIEGRRLGIPWSWVLLLPGSPASSTCSNRPDSRFSS